MRPIAERLPTLGLFDHVSRDRGIIVDWVGIRHWTNTCPSTRDRRRTARRDRFLVLLSGFPQMDVHVNKAGSDDQARSVKNLGILGFGVIWADPSRDLAVLDQQILAAILVLGRIN